MNGTTLRAATALACVVALAAPGSALAAKKNHRVVKRTAVTKKVAAPKVTVEVPHIYDAGGNGGESYAGTATKVNLFDPLQLAQNLGNSALGQLGLPALPALPALPGV